MSPRRSPTLIRPIRPIRLICLICLLLPSGLVQTVSAETPQIRQETSLASPETAPSSSTRVADILSSITIFVLAIFVGFEVITKVPPTLHTPLMSGSNAISGITIVGALLASGVQSSAWISLLGLLATVLATINVVGGFVVTDRMLGMFRSTRN